MPTYKVTDPQTGKTLRLTGDSPPSEQELEQIFTTHNGSTKDVYNDGGGFGGFMQGAGEVVNSAMMAAGAGVGVYGAAKGIGIAGRAIKKANLGKAVQLGEDAYKGARQFITDAGQEIGALRRGVVGKTLIPEKPIQTVLNHMPPTATKAIAEDAKVLKYNDGTVVPTISNVMRMKTILSDAVKDPTFVSQLGAPEKQKTLAKGVNVLGKIAEHHVPELTKLNAEYSTRIKTAEETLSALKNSVGNPTPGKVLRMVLSKEEGVQQRLMAMEDAIPAVRKLTDAYRSGLRFKRLGKAAALVGDRALQGAGLSAGGLSVYQVHKALTD